MSSFFNRLLSIYNYNPLSSTVSSSSAASASSCLHQFIFGSSDHQSNNSTTSSSASSVIEQLSSTPIKLKNPVKLNNNNNNDLDVVVVDSIHISVIKNPRETLTNTTNTDSEHDSPSSTSSSPLNRLRSLLLPYTSRAFKQPIETISAAEMQEHFDHMTHGDYLFLASAVSSSITTTSNSLSSETKKEDAPFIVFHLLCSSIEISNRRAMCCAGRCCDPTFQNNGLATIVHSAALDFLKPKLIITRTVNPSILKLLRRTSPAGSKLYPNDLVFRNNNKNDHENENEEDSNIVEEEWKLAREIANDAVKKWSQLSADIGRYDPEKMVFKGAYSNIDENVFGSGGGKTNQNEKEKEGEKEEMMKSKVKDEKEEEFKDVDIAPGDAQLRIVVFP